MRRGAGLALWATMLAILVGCGAGAAGSSSGADSGPLVVSAASSLQDAFTQYARRFGGGGKTRLSFAGSDALAAQIRQGVKPDVFAAANTKLPEQLYRAGLVEKPTVFARNRLVLAVGAHSRRVSSLGDVQRPGVTVAIGSASVPVGAYTRKVLGGLGHGERARILRNVRSEEPDVKGVIGKLTQGAVDAGFVYITDVTATRGALRAIALPPALQPSVAYGAAPVRGAKHLDQAPRFIAGLLRGGGRRALRAAGFEPPGR